MKFKAAVFDLDGTLLDTLDDLTDSVNHALSQCGYPVHTRDEVCSFVGNGIKNLMKKAVPDGENDPLFEKAFSLFKEHYAENCLNKTAPYTGIMDMLKKLKELNVKTAIVSNKADFAVKSLADDFFGGLVLSAIGEREGTARKPAPDTVYLALKEIGADISEAVYIGDSDVDIKTAANAGIPCISVSWGFRSREFLLEHGAEIIIDSPDELFEYL
ncbi:MAG: HAD family hydrolase [Oscillospiraceae bacterium]|nr:HAD family hydrolase [Oscillospiraceae bacterium]